MNTSTPTFKIVILGEGRVGKTSMTLKYVNNQFSDKQQSSINACFLQKDVRLVDHNKNVKLVIWDTAGQQKYNAVAPIYYKDAVGAIVVYEIASTQSFEKVKKWVEQLRQHAVNKDLVIYIAGNKCDMQTQRTVDKKMVQKYAKEKGVKHFLVSAKSGHQINELFHDLAQDVFSHSKKNTGYLISPKGNSQRLVLQREDPKKEKEKKPCC